MHKIHTEIKCPQAKIYFQKWSEGGKWICDGIDALPEYEMRMCDPSTLKDELFLTMKMHEKNWNAHEENSKDERRSAKNCNEY